MDSCCSKHMTGNIQLLSSFQNKDGGTVTFGDNNKGKVIGIGSVGNPNKPIIDNVLLVNGLKHNLLSISQLCYKGFKDVFEKESCLIYDIDLITIIFKGHRKNNIYVLSMNNISNEHCLIASSNDSILWHKRFGHVNFKHMSKISKNDSVNGLPKMSFKNNFCDACQQGKMHKSSFKSKNVISTNRPLELIHIDLFGPSRVASLNGSRYAFVLVDDFSRFTWVIFLKHKNDAFNEFSIFCKKI